MDVLHPLLGRPLLINHTQIHLGPPDCLSQRLAGVTRYLFAVALKSLLAKSCGYLVNLISDQCISFALEVC
jgi:hypothetical protein